MADRSKIEWTDATWNPIRARRRDTGKVGWHCEHVSEGCRHCYSEGLNKRLGTGLAYKPGHAADLEVFLDEKMLLQPLRWRQPRMIFVGSMTDLFADFVTDEMLDGIFAVMAICPQHTFQVLTKRPWRMKRYFDDRRGGDPWAESADTIADLMGWENHAVVLESRDIPLPNVWLGTSAEDQSAYQLRWSDVAATPAIVRFLSAEPLLGDLGNLDLGRVGAPTWIIVGGESGPHARPMHPEWARSLRSQCAAAGVPFFFKQWGEWGLTHPDWPRAKPTVMANDGTLYEPADLAFPDGARYGEALRAGHDKAHLTSIYRVGKMVAGRLLDDVEHNAIPEVTR